MSQAAARYGKSKHVAYGFLCKGSEGDYISQFGDWSYCDNFNRHIHAYNYVYVGIYNIFDQKQ